MPKQTIATLAITITLAGTLAIPSATANTAAEVFKGKRIEMIVGNGVGGGYDVYARLLTRHMGRHLPGNPTFVVRNMDGAGTAVAANYLYFNAPQDGTAIGMIGDGVYLSQQLGEARIKFDMMEMNWIGRLTNNTPVLFSWHASPIRSTQDMLTKTMIVAADGDTPRLNYALLGALVGVKMEVISGYKTAGEVMLAMERGEVHGVARPWPVVLAAHADLITTKKIIPVLQTGAEKHESLPNVPRMIDLAKNDEDRQVFEFIAQSSRVGRSIIATAKVPADTLAVLRKAFMDSVKDAEFLADADRSKLDLAILDGAQLDAVVKKDEQHPAVVVERAKAAVRQIKGN